MALIVIDVLPTRGWNVPLKLPVAQLLDWAGMRQGSWAMFTPNPVLSNRWISAEQKTKDGRTMNWDSTLWARASVSDKFLKFRHINYYNRINQDWCRDGAQDFLDYKFRTADEPLQSLKLYINRMEIVMPEDGSLPPRDEAEWRLISEPWLSKSAAP